MEVGLDSGDDGIGIAPLDVQVPLEHAEEWVGRLNGVGGDELRFESVLQGLKLSEGGMAHVGRTLATGVDREEAAIVTRHQSVLLTKMPLRGLSVEPGPMEPMMCLIPVSMERAGGASVDFAFRSGAGSALVLTESFVGLEDVGGLGWIAVYEM